MASSWQVRLAAVLVGLNAALGVVLLVLATRVTKSDPGFLFAVLPFVALFLFLVGAFLVTASLTLAVRLLGCARTARLHTAGLGALLCVLGAMALPASVPAGLLMLLEGGTLVWLMASPGAAADLGGWVEPLKPPAPWGSTPGTKLWSPEPQQQGPWSPDPTTLPVMSWKGVSGPRPPWWQTWQAGLAQGIPLWELILLCSALAAFLLGVVAIPFAVGGSPSFGNLHLRSGRAAWLLLLLPVSGAVVQWLERRMRARLAGRG